jgi:hypothetical protein
MARAKRIPAVEARVHLGRIMKRAYSNGDRFIVEKSGIPMVAIINADDYALLVEAREEHFKVLDRVRAKLPDVDAGEAAKDVRAAVKSARKRSAKNRS